VQGIISSKTNNNMRKEQHYKGWNEIKANDSWAIFKIMGNLFLDLKK